MTRTESSSADGSQASQRAIVAAILERIEAGEAVDLEEEIARYHDIASSLRKDLSALLWSLRSLGLAANTPPPQPSHIGGYHVFERIGRGGEGASVFRAVQQVTGQVVALKVLPPRCDERQVQRFLMQRQFAALHHQHIVLVFDAGESDGFHYLAMELMEGGSLAAILVALRRESPLALRQLPGEILGQMCLGPDRIPLQPFDRIRREGHVRWAVATVRDVALALHQVHQDGLIHRDVKPSNVLLSAEGKPRLADFGLARRVAVSELTRSGETPGTRPYMSPEQVDSNSGVLDHRSDIYSLGATLYELLTCRRPLQEDADIGVSDAELIDRIRYQKPVDCHRLNPAIPRDLATLVAKLLEKVPEDRVESAAELATQLQLFLDGAPMSVRPIHWPTRLLRKARRRPVVAAVVLATVIMLLLLIGFSAATVLERERTLGKERNRRAEGNLLLTRAALRDGAFDLAARVAPLATEQVLGVLRELSDPVEISKCLCDLAELSLARDDAAGARAVLDRVPHSPKGMTVGEYRRLLTLRKDVLLAVEPAAAPEALRQLADLGDSAPDERASFRLQANLVEQLARERTLELPGVIDLSSPWSEEPVPFVARNGDVGLWRMDGTARERGRLPEWVRKLIQENSIPTLLVARGPRPSTRSADSFYCLLQVQSTLIRFTVSASDTDGEVQIEEARLRDALQDPPADGGRHTQLIVLESDDEGRPERVYVATRTTSSGASLGDYEVVFGNSQPVVHAVRGTESATLSVQHMVGSGGQLALAQGEWGGFGFVFLERREHELMMANIQRIGYVSGLEPVMATSSDLWFLLGKGSFWKSTSFFDAGGLREWRTGVYLVRLAIESKLEMEPVAQDTYADDRLRWQVAVAADVNVVTPAIEGSVHLAVFFSKVRQELRVYARTPLRLQGKVTLTPLIRLRSSLPGGLRLLHCDLDHDGDDEVFAGEAAWNEVTGKAELTVVGLGGKP